jgi:hypothetical protein
MLVTAPDSEESLDVHLVRAPDIVNSRVSSYLRHLTSPALPESG